MCFSATASFTATAVLTGVGTVTVVKVYHTRALAFAASTLIFAAQQACEGFLWLGFAHPQFARWVQPLTYLFLFFAQVVWPFWVPFSIYLMERRNRKILQPFLVAGMLYAVYAACVMMLYMPVATVVHHHILYDLNFPQVLFRYFTTAIYFLVTVAPFFVSSMNRMRAFGLVLFASFVVSYLLYPAFVISIWCYYAAALSLLVLYVVKDIPLIHRSTTLPESNKFV